MEGKAKPTLLYPVAVEGKYDKIKLDSLFDGRIFTTGGFSLFNDEEKRRFFRRLAEKTPVIVFTDSDSGGAQIRRLFKDLLPPDRQIHLYIPQIKGKEKRKKAPSKQGFLGVEGIDGDLLRGIFAPFTAEGANAADSGSGALPDDASGASANGAQTAAARLFPAPPSRGEPLRRIDLYKRGYEGAENSKEKRQALAERCGLPQNLSTTALLDALNLLYDREELEKML